LERAKGKVARSSGNVFRDLGFAGEEAEHLLIRSELMIKIDKLLTARGLTQSGAAKIMRVSQPRVSDLLRGRLDLFSTDALIDMLARLGVSVRLAFPLRSSIMLGFVSFNSLFGVATPISAARCSRS
jgi:predicted XRE-type DNA-binding protein